MHKSKSMQINRVICFGYEGAHKAERERRPRQEVVVVAAVASIHYWLNDSKLQGLVARIYIQHWRHTHFNTFMPILWCEA